jgi:hypothetical protein
MINGNIVGYLVLIGVILGSSVILMAKRPEETAMNFLVGTTLFMPVGAALKLPLMPTLDRNTLPFLCVFIMYSVRRSGVLGKIRLGRGADRLVIIAMLCAIGTYLTNTDRIAIAKYRPLFALGLGPQDAFAFIRDDVVGLGIPLILGRMLVRTPEQGVHVLKAFAGGGLAYAIPILIELRVSPQLHYWIYGTHPTTDFNMVFRWGGYRPLAFMPNGLAVAMFMCMATLAMITLARMGRKFHGFSAKKLAIFLLVLFVACKSTAAIAYAALAAPLIYFTKPRKQVRVGMILGLVFLIYPALRAMELVPDKALVELVEKYTDEDRAGSIASRFHSEELLLTKVRQGHLAFGWGGYGRPNAYDDYGISQSIFDGFWITEMSHRGVIYLVCISLMLIWPILLARKRVRRITDVEQRAVMGGLSLMLGVAVLDLIPNGLFAIYPVFLSGAFVGYIRAIDTYRPPANETGQRPEYRESLVPTSPGYPTTTYPPGVG